MLFCFCIVWTRCGLVLFKLFLLDAILYDDPKWFGSFADTVRQHSPESWSSKICFAQVLPAAAKARVLILSCMGVILWWTQLTQTSSFAFMSVPAKGSGHIFAEWKPGATSCLSCWNILKKFWTTGDKQSKKK